MIQFVVVMAETYGNACEAAGSGVTVDYQGVCQADAATCGGPDSVVCENGADFCKYPVGSCGANQAQGSCNARPVGCGAVFDPVCGCDGQEYSNSCTADAAGVSVAYDQACYSQQTMSPAKVGTISYFGLKIHLAHVLVIVHLI